MNVEFFVTELKRIGIHTLTGVPDSLLRPFCDYLNLWPDPDLHHYIAPNEGSAIGFAAGTYLSTGHPAGIYMQNSGIGNMINPYTSISHTDVYGIPMLFIIGWRGEPGVYDEPQHKFMGKITTDILTTLQIDYSILSKSTTCDELPGLLQKARDQLQRNRQYALIIKKDAFEVKNTAEYHNTFILNREMAIGEIIKKTTPQDIIVSTTGKISREVYEQCDRIKGDHQQAFLTVGGMGHASMIALAISLESKEKRVFCMDGDGALLMHLGNMAMIGQQNPHNLVHICINNTAHESVGGMPTAHMDINWKELAHACGYQAIYEVNNPAELNSILDLTILNRRLTFIVINVAISSRSALGRPKESAAENKIKFMNYHLNN